MPVDFDNEDCIDGACFLRNQMISIDRSKTDPTTNLAYNEMSLAYVNTQNLLAACLPDVDKASVAGSFETCTGKKMEGVCVHSNRGWLIKDSANETVANLAFLETAFSGLAGGNEAVRKCLKIKEKEEELDDNYVYEYEYYDYDYDDYDYLEEGEVMEVRRKREAGKEGSKKGPGKKGKDGKKGEGKKKERKGKGRNSKKTVGKKGAKKGGKKGKGRNNKKGENKGKGKNGKQNDGGNGGKTSGQKVNGKKGNGNNRNVGKKGKGKGEKGRKHHGNKGIRYKGNKENSEERKFVKTEDEKPSAKNEAKVNAKLKKLGFSKMPTKSTLKGLECIWDNLELLLVKCGEQIISDSP